MTASVLASRDPVLIGLPMVNDGGFGVVARGVAGVSWLHPAAAHSDTTRHSVARARSMTDPRLNWIDGRESTDNPQRPRDPCVAKASRLSACATRRAPARPRARRPSWEA